MLDITVIILTKNEELHVERAVRNVIGLVRRVVVVDSGSSDRTVQLARDLGADVYDHAFINYAKQFQWAVENCAIDTKWLMRLDADEYLEADLKAQLESILPAVDEDVVGINFKRKHIFWNRWIRFGGRYPLLLLRLWRTGFGRIEDRWMDEHIVISGGRAISLNGGFCDENLNNLSFFTDKHNKYATREALDVLIGRYKLADQDLGLNRGSTSFQASLKRLAKEKTYNKLPFPISSFLYFVWRYFFQLGFLDGLPGLVYHFLQGFWYRFLVGAKIKELESSIDFSLEKEVILKEIELATGHRI